MKYFALVLATILALQSANSLAAGPACEDAFVTTRTLHLVDSPLPTDSKDPEFKERIIDLLDMYLSSVFQENEKNPFKKRELFFAREIGEGQTLEFEYEGDQRTGERVYRLSKVSLYKANGQDLVLQKDPLTDDGEGLRQNSFEISSSDVGLPVDAADHYAVPLKIDGAALKALTPWLERIPHLTRVEIKEAIDRDQVTPLVWKASLLSNLKFAAKTAKKQLFKTVLIVGVVAGFQHIPYSQLINPLSNKATVTQQAESLGEVERLSALEEKLGSAPLIYAQPQVNAQGGAVLIGFPRQSKIILIPTDKNGAMLKAGTVTVSKATNPAGFASLSARLTNGLTPSK